MLSMTGRSGRSHQEMALGDAVRPGLHEAMTSACQFPDRRFGNKIRRTQRGVERVRDVQLIQRVQAVALSHGGL